MTALIVSQVVLFLMLLIVIMGSRASTRRHMQRYHEQVNAKQEAEREVERLNKSNQKLYELEQAHRNKPKTAYLVAIGTSNGQNFAWGKFVEIVGEERVSVPVSFLREVDPGLSCFCFSSEIALEDVMFGNQSLAPFFGSGGAGFFASCHHTISVSTQVTFRLRGIPSKELR